MKFLLILQVNARVLERLTTEESEAVRAGHREFQRVASEAGEMVSTQALADPSRSTVVRSQGGLPVVSTGPLRAVGEYMGGYYLIDVDDVDRALELANLLPDVRIDGLAVEIRPVMGGTGTDL